ncbi:MAG: hypothetical protein AVDCRST_MAG47-3053, partial [uncultured Nocardioidaceae bacterium]
GRRPALERGAAGARLDDGVAVVQAQRQRGCASSRREFLWVRREAVA